MSFARRYKGPASLREDMGTAIDILSNSLSVDQKVTAQHIVLVVNGFTDDASLHATAVYLVGAIAAAIEQNLRLRAALYEQETVTRELSQDVQSVISDDRADEDFKTMVRNPWLWEGISHMFVHLSARDSRFHPSGEILVKTSIKHDVHDHGLDVIAVYRGGVIGVSAGECKAYLTDPATGIRDASTKLGEIDNNLRDKELRSTLIQLQNALSPLDQAQIAGAFWRNERSYLPFVCCDSSSSCDWARSRQALNRLCVPASKKILVPLPIDEARATFDLLCLLMREYSAIEA